MGGLRRFIFLALLFAAGGAACAEPVLVSTGNDYAPYTGQDLPQGGLVTAIVARIFAEMHQDFRLVWVPWSRALDGVRTGAYAASFPYARTAERETNFIFSDTLLDIRQILVFRSNSGVKPGDLTSLEGKRFCVPIGWALLPLQPFADESKVKLERPRDMDSCVRLLQSDRADFFIAPEGQIPESSLQGPLTKSEIPIGTLSARLVMSKSAPEAAELMDRFNGALRALKARGEIDRRPKK